jgi:hypothetical protein
LNFSQNTARAAPKVVINNGKSKIKKKLLFFFVNQFVLSAKQNVKLTFFFQKYYSYVSLKKKLTKVRQTKNKSIKRSYV